MASKKIFKNNLKLANNIKLLQNSCLEKRALVLDQSLSKLSHIDLSTYYNIIILDSSAVKYKFLPDFVILKESSIYKSNERFLDIYSGNETTLFVTNGQLIGSLKKTKYVPNIFNVNYLKSNGGLVPSIHSELGIEAGLSEAYTGVHLAMILGCKDIYSTQATPGSVVVDEDRILEFITEKDPKNKLVSRNLISTKRPPYLLARL